VETAVFPAVENGASPFGTFGGSVRLVTWRGGSAVQPWLSALARVYGMVAGRIVSPGDVPRRG
jgi:hypothetical protein